MEKGLVKEAEERDPKIQVSERCKKAILRVAELSSDDFHLDRHLYFACRGWGESEWREVAGGDVVQ